MDLDGRQAVVTGAGGGLGEVIALDLAGRGARVVVVDRSGDAARAVARQVGGTAVLADLSDPAAVDVIAAAARGTTLLVNCAGGWGGSRQHYPEAEPAQWEAVLRLNLLAPMALTRRLQPQMTVAGGGAVVHVSSSAATGTGAYRSPEYAVAKAGLLRLATACADWTQRFAVRVDVVVPDWIGLPRAHDELAAMSAAERAAAPPLIEPARLAGVVADLLADDSSGGRVVAVAGVPDR